MATGMTSVELTARLVGFDTTSRESNLALIEFVRDYLDGFGVASELVYDSAQPKANLFATIGPQDRPGVLFSGHSDVVPVDGQAWESDPFRVTERDGKLFGRGTADMKGFIATVLSLVPELVTQRLDTPVHLAFTYDEEVGCFGVQTLLAALAERAIKPKACVIGEPTLMKPVIAHKGRHCFRCHVRGLESHSALAHRGVNAIEAAAGIVARIRTMARRKREQGPFDQGFMPPHTTMQTGTIAGGTALNIVPRDCHFDFEIRNLPQDDLAAIRYEIETEAASISEEMRGVDPATGIRFEEISINPPLSTPPDSDLVRLVQAFTGANDLGKVSFVTEAGFFHQSEIPTVVCGPGSIDQAHKPNEFIAVEQLGHCETFLRRYIGRLAASA